MLYFISFYFVIFSNIQQCFKTFQNIIKCFWDVCKQHKTFSKHLQIFWYWFVFPGVGVGVVWKLEWCWSGLEGAGVAWNSVGVVWRVLE